MSGPLRATERRHPASTDLDQLSPGALVALFAEVDRDVPDAVARAHEAITAVLIRLEAGMRAGGRLIYVGAGSSGRLGVLDAAECPPTFGTPPTLVQGVIAGGPAALTEAVEGAEDNEGAGAEAMVARGIVAPDLVLGIAASGTTPFVRGALAQARALGATTVLLTCAAPPIELTVLCDEVIHVAVGPELLTGSTRLKAGTATKLVLNTLTTGVMVRLGKTWGNLMVDLRATNAKLRDRGERIVMLVAGLSRDEAQAALVAANGDVRTAIAMVRCGLDQDAARRALAAADQRLRALIGPPPRPSDD